MKAMKSRRLEMCLRYLLNGGKLSQPVVRQLVFLRHWSETVVRPDELVE